MEAHLGRERQCGQSRCHGRSAGPGLHARDAGRGRRARRSPPCRRRDVAQPRALVCGRRPSFPSMAQCNIHGEQGFALSPMQDGIRLCGQVEFAGLKAPPDFRRVRGLLPAAKRMLPGLVPEEQSAWLGFRPSLPEFAAGDRPVAPLRRRLPGLRPRTFGHDTRAADRPRHRGSDRRAGSRFQHLALSPRAPIAPG